ncbi:MAG: hypothetical protein RSE33_16350 [Hafnia sp.]|uniref:hypothetical protein n=1 Tax=Citrobacter sp. TaxID=1896336 RepID=UPI002FC6190E
MSKSLNARCIRRWAVEFKSRCDSKHSPYWRKHHLRSYIRECALTTADSMVYRLAEKRAWEVCPVADERGWTPEFSAWYTTRREKFRKEALEFLNSHATNDEIDEEIQNELEAWND